MTIESQTQPAPRGERKLLFLTVGLLYALTSSGDLVGDTEIRWAVAERLAETGWVDLPAGVTPLSAQGTDGRWYSFYGPGQSVCLVPFVWAGRALAAAPLPLATSADMGGQFLASVIFFPVCGALAAVLLYGIVLDATGRAKLARWIALIFAVATMHWQHTINTYEESQVAVCVLAALWAFQRAWRGGGWRYLLVGFAAVGAGACFRPSSVVLSGPMAAVALGADLVRRSGAAVRWRRFGQWTAAAVVAMGPFILALMAYNHARFGSPWRTGYVAAHQAMGDGVELFATPLWTGLTGMLASPGKSVFLFNPVLILGVFGFVGLWRRQRALAAVVLAASVCTVVFHSRYTYWSGDLAWGPRLLASAMGLAALTLIPPLQWRRGRWLVVAVVALSVCVQLASVVYSFGLEFYQDRRHGTIPNGYVWRPGQSQLYCRGRNIVLHAAGRPVYESIPPERIRPETHQVPATAEQVRRIHAVNLFPFKARANTGPGKLFYALLAVWGATLAAWGGTVLRWWRRARAPTRNPQSQ